MLKVCLTSGCKGGTGKSTLAVLLTILYSGAGKRTILIDTGAGGNSSHIIITNPPPPYLRNIINDGDAIEAIIKCELSIKDKTVDFYLIPNDGPLGSVNNNSVRKLLKSIEKFFDIAIFDLPAYQNGEYNSFVDNCDIVLLIYNPSDFIIKAVSKCYTGNRIVIPVLNKHLGIEKYLANIRKMHNSVFTIPFDPYLSIMNPGNLSNVLARISSQVQKNLVELALKIATVKKGFDKKVSKVSLLKVNTILRR